MNLDQEIKDRARDALARMGFRQNVTDAEGHEEWVLTDPESQSFVSVEFRTFEQTDDMGFWKVSPWVSLISANGGRWADPIDEVVLGLKAEIARGGKPTP